MYSTDATPPFTIPPHVRSPTQTHVAMRSGTLENSIDIQPSALLSDCKRTVWEDWLWQNGLLCYWLQFRKCCLLLLSPPPFHSRDPAGPQPQPTISLIALLRKTHLSKVTEPRVGGGGCTFPLTHIPFPSYFSHSFKPNVYFFSHNLQPSLSPTLSPTCLGGQPLKCCIVAGCRYIGTKHLTLCWLRS